MNTALSTWQIEEIRKGIEEADRREFASEREVRKTLKKWLEKERIETSCNSAEFPNQSS